MRIIKRIIWVFDFKFLRVVFQDDRHLAATRGKLLPNLPTLSTLLQSEKNENFLKMAFVRIFDIPAPWQNASPSFPRTFLVVMVCPPGAPSRSAHHQPRQVRLREAVVDHCASFLHRSCHLGPALSNIEASGEHVAL